MLRIVVDNLIGFLKESRGGISANVLSKHFQRRLIHFTITPSPKATSETIAMPANSNMVCFAENSPYITFLRGSVWRERLSLFA